VSDWESGLNGDRIELEALIGVELDLQVGLSRGDGVQLDAQSADDAENGAKLRIAARGERLVEALAAESGLPSHLGHALGARDVPESRSDDARIALLECSFEVSDNVGIALQMVGRVPSFCFRLSHLASEF
jgi:hypothetical protein